MTTAQVHRFRQAVALHSGDGQTVYMTAANARKLAKALNACARSVTRETFSQSTCGTHTVDVALSGSIAASEIKHGA